MIKTKSMLSFEYDDEENIILIISKIIYLSDSSDLSSIGNDNILSKNNSNVEIIVEKQF